MIIDNSPSSSKIINQQSFEFTKPSPSALLWKLTIWVCIWHAASYETILILMRYLCMILRKGKNLCSVKPNGENMTGHIVV